MKNSHPDEVLASMSSESSVQDSEDSSNDMDSSPCESPKVDRISTPTPIDMGGEKPTDGLRRVLLPMHLCEEFLAAAQKNTDIEIETCGVLCGSLINNEYLISNVILPQQKGGPDFCFAEHEEEVFFLQEEMSLVTLGWIHTHPTQTAFLSSIDLHTHHAYQMMLPEAIAIVCAPRCQQTGVFRLTDHGLREISHCPKRGFHPHQQEFALFDDCKHVILTDTTVTITDLR